VSQRSEALGVETLIRVQPGEEGPARRIGVERVEVAEQEGDCRVWCGGL
jgi:hypothetical protein